MVSLCYASLTRKRPTRPYNARWPVQTKNRPEVRRLGTQIGIEVRGVDVKTLDDETFGVLYRAWLDGNLLVMPDQALELEDFLWYISRLAGVVPLPSKMTPLTAQ